MIVVVMSVVGVFSGWQHWSWHAVGVWGNALAACAWACLCGGFVCGVGVVVENCIVDASIFWFL